MNINKFMKWIGFYKENNHLKVDGRRIYYWIMLLIIIRLGHEALFIFPLTLDKWGFTSPYLTKLLIIMLGLFVWWFWWGYSRLSKRVDKLEKKQEDVK